MQSMWSIFTEECEAWSAYHVSEVCKIVCEAIDAWFSKWGMWSMLSMATEMWECLTFLVRFWIQVAWLSLLAV